MSSLFKKKKKKKEILISDCKCLLHIYRMYIKYLVKTRDAKWSSLKRSENYSISMNKKDSVWYCFCVMLLKKKTIKELHITPEESQRMYWLKHVNTKTEFNFWIIFLNGYWYNFKSWYKCISDLIFELLHYQAFI